VALGSQVIVSGGSDNTVAIRRHPDSYAVATIDVLASVGALEMTDNGVLGVVAGGTLCAFALPK
jgi:hypothetical protein